MAETLLKNERDIAAEEIMKRLQADNARLRRLLADAEDALAYMERNGLRINPPCLNNIRAALSTTE